MFDKTLSLWRRILPKAHGSSPVLETGTAVAIQEDRRLWVRYTTDLDATVQLAEKKGVQRLSAHIRDISLGGANLQVNRSFQTGQLLTLELPGPGGTVRSTLACVVRVIMEDEGQWSVGCVFSQELTTADLEAFGARRLKHGDEEQRTWKRFSCQMKANFQIIGDAEEDTYAAQILNISTNGVGLLVQQALEPGCLLSLDLLDKRGRVARSILSCVVHTTRRANGDLAIGCNFIRELAEDELAALL